MEEGREVSSSDYINDLKIIKRIERLKGEIWIMSELIKKYVNEICDVQNTLLLLKSREDIPRDARKTIEICSYKLLAIVTKMMRLTHDYVNSRQYLEAIAEMCQVLGPYQTARRLSKSISYIYRLWHTYEVLKDYLDKIDQIPVSYLIELAYTIHDLGPKDREFVINEFLKAYRSNQLSDTRAVRKLLKQLKSYVISLHKYH